MSFFIFLVLYVLGMNISYLIIQYDMGMNYSKYMTEKDYRNILFNSWYFVYLRYKLYKKTKERFKYTSVDNIKSIEKHVQ